MAKEVELLEDEVQSHYDKIRRRWTLLCMVKLFNAIAELRLSAEYLKLEIKRIMTLPHSIIGGECEPDLQTFISWSAFAKALRRKGTSPQKRRYRRR